MLLKFLIVKISDHKYQEVIIEVTRMVIDMYLGIFGGCSQTIDELVMKDLKQKVNEEILSIETLGEIKGQVVNILYSFNFAYFRK